MKADEKGGMGSFVSDSFLSKRFFSGMVDRAVAFAGHVFRRLSSFFHTSVQIKPSRGPNTLQELLVQFQQVPPEKNQKQVEQHYLIMEKMVLLELEYLQEGPARAFVGMSKVLDEEEGENVYKIRFVPCIVRPEVLFRGFGKN